MCMKPKLLPDVRKVTILQYETEVRAKNYTILQNYWQEGKITS